MDSHDFNKNLEIIINNFLTDFSKNKEKNFENYSIFEKNQYNFNLINKKYKTNNERYFKKLINYKNSDKKKEINMNISNNNEFKINNILDNDNYINKINANDSDKIKEIILKNPSEIPINNTKNVNFNININSIHNIILSNNNDYHLSNKNISLNENEETKNEFEKLINLLESKNINYILNFKHNIHKMNFKIKKKKCFYEYSIKININKKIIFIEKMETNINRLKTSYKIDDNTIQKGINELFNLLNN